MNHRNQNMEENTHTHTYTQNCKCVWHLRIRQMREWWWSSSCTFLLFCVCLVCMRKIAVPPPEKHIIFLGWYVKSGSFGKFLTIQRAKESEATSMCVCACGFSHDPCILHFTSWLVCLTLSYLGAGWLWRNTLKCLLSVFPFFFEDHLLHCNETA